MSSIAAPRHLLARLGLDLLFVLGLIAGLALPVMASATGFTISTASTTAQTLGSGPGELGTVTAAGSLTVGGSTVAVTISGTAETLYNLGTIKQTGTGRVIRDNSGVASLVINNGSSTNSTALMQAADADVIQMNKSPASVTLNNYGIMTSLNASAAGNQVIDFNAILSGSNILNNYSTGILQAAEADAVRTGVNGMVYNAGLIKSTTSTGGSSDGIDLQTNTGAQITNDTTGTVNGARHGITGGPVDSVTAFTASITNNAGGVIKGSNGSGINFDGFNANQTATIVNHGTITGNGVTGDGDGIDIDGVINLTNDGIIRSLNAVGGATPGQSEGISVGGGTITNSGTIEGLVAAGNTNAVGRGISLLGNDISTGPLAGTREALYANATIINNAGGLIRGDSDSGIAVDGPASGHTVNITNNTGATIRGGGTANAAIRTAGDADTVTNSGTIDGSSSGKAVDLAGGNDTLNYSGGTITGTIDGGVGTNTLNLGNGVSHASATQNFQNVNVASGAGTLAGVVSSINGLTKGGSGTLVLTAANDYTGGTMVTAGLLKVNNTTGSGTGAGAVTVQSGAAIGGSGLIAGLLTLDGALAPGNSLGTLTTLSDVVWNGTAANAWAFELGSSGASDRLVAGGSFLKGTGTDFSFDFQNTSGSGTYVLVDWAASSSFLASDFNYVNLGNGQTGTFALNGSQLEFSTFAAIPEPSTYAALLGVGTLGFVAFRRRQAARKQIDV